MPTITSGARLTCRGLPASLFRASSARMNRSGATTWPRSTPMRHARPASMPASMSKRTGHLNVRLMRSRGCMPNMTVPGGQWRSSAQQICSTTVCKQRSTHSKKRLRSCVGPDSSCLGMTTLRSASLQPPTPCAICGSLDRWYDTRLQQYIAALQSPTPLCRETSLQLHWHDNPTFRFASAPDRMRDPVFRRNIGRLAALDWVFELQVFSPQMEDAAELVAEHP